MFRATVTPAWDLDAWRVQARHAWEAALPPEDVEWQADAQGELLAATPVADQPGRRKGLSVPAEFMAFAASVLCHRDAGRHALLYRLLWRIGNGERALLDRATDADVHRTMRWAQAVRRDTHKMKAFVRFRQVDGEDNAYIAWFEPDHFIVDRVAPFFMRRFAGMRWAILTPYRSVQWDGSQLWAGEGAQRSDAPADDAEDTLWRTYYANIFNPARLNTRMMRQEMPQKYWKHLPEAHLLPDLVREAGRRVREMDEREAQAPRRRIPARVRPPRD